MTLTKKDLLEACKKAHFRIKNHGSDFPHVKAQEIVLDVLETIFTFLPDDKNSQAAKNLDEKTMLSLLRK